MLAPVRMRVFVHLQYWYIRKQDLNSFLLALGECLQHVAVPRLLLHFCEEVDLQRIMSATYQGMSASRYKEASCIS